MTSRQQQRQRERALVKTGEAAIKAGLPTAAPRSDLIAVATVLAKTLLDSNQNDRASTAAVAMHTLTEASTRRNPGAAKLACAKGCHFCCHTWVGATAPEIFLLARVLKGDAARKPGEIKRILDAARPLMGLSPAERYGAQLPCPLLVDKACSRYRDRPAVCRQATSFDLAGCMDEYEGRGRGDEIKVSAVYLAHTRNSRLPLLAALKSAKLPITIYELAAGLSRALETENPEARWLAGEDVFAGINGSQEPPEILRVVDEIAREMNGEG